MEKILLPGLLRGSVRLPFSKSELHRALICAALSPGETAVCAPVPCEDVRATAAGLAALGADVQYRDEKYYVNQIDPARSAVLDCGESGTSLRFLLPLAAALGVEAEFCCRGRLAERPMSPLLAVLNANGCTVNREGQSFRLSGRLQPGDYLLDASASSQFLSGLLLALPLLQGSSIQLCGSVASKDYVNLTATVMQRFGVTASRRVDRCRVAGTYRSPGDYAPEGDWSAAAFWLCANAIGSEISPEGLSAESLQPDRAVTALISAVRAGGAVISAARTPDLLPPLAVLAAVTPGETRFTEAARLRQKESDRLAALSAMLKALGGDCTETADGLCIRGVPSLRGGTVDSFGDHRIAMAAAIAAAVCTAPLTLRGAEAVEKSYPAFWSDFARLGGKSE